MKDGAKAYEKQEKIHDQYIFIEKFINRYVMQVKDHIYLNLQNGLHFLCFPILYSIHAVEIEMISSYENYDTNQSSNL